MNEMLSHVQLRLLILLWQALCTLGVVVETEMGRVQGSTKGACTRFFGIPYATPPTGAKRWRPPEPPEAWSDIRDATQDSHAICLQNWDEGVMNEITNGFLGRDYFQRLLNLLWGRRGDEDCLFLNVQTPSVAPSKLLPVIVYIHGGTNLCGSGSGYDADQLCQRDVVFVSLNYRLGVLGNMALLEALNESGTTGNYGLQDQRFALQWVRRNIERFGGDPARITLMGESAGAMAVLAHTALPRSRGLFAQGIAMSGNDDSLPLAEAMSMSGKFSEHLGCHGEEVLGCLRSKKGEALIGAQLSIYNQSMRGLQVPVEDGFELQKGITLRSLYASGHVPKKPLLAGTNLNDSSMFFALTPKEILRGVLQQDLNHSINRFFVNTTRQVREEIRALYQPADFGGERLALYALGTDGYFECPTRRVLQSLTSRGSQVFHYIYAAKPANSARALGLPGWLNIFLELIPLFRWLGAFHGSNEVLFWGAADPSSGLTAKERSLGLRMVNAWVAFAQGGQPWPLYGVEEEHLFLDLGEDRPGRAWRSTQCKVLEKYRFLWNPLEDPYKSIPPVSKLRREVDDKALQVFV